MLGEHPLGGCNLPSAEAAEECGDSRKHAFLALGEELGKNMEPRELRGGSPQMHGAGRNVPEPPLPVPRVWRVRGTWSASSGPGLSQHLRKGPWLFFANCLPESPCLELPNLMLFGFWLGLPTLWDIRMPFPAYSGIPRLKLPALVRTAMPQTGPFAWNPSTFLPATPSFSCSGYTLSNLKMFNLSPPPHNEN